MVSMTERLVDLASSAFLHPARVTAASQLSDRFVCVELHSPAFRSASWTPGVKLQLRPRRGTWGLRTYTPFDGDHQRGTVRLLAYVHGTGPAAQWFSHARTGQDCELSGPRRSIDLHPADPQILFVGDESSVGLACALHSRTVSTTHVFEATDPAELRTVLDQLDLGDRSTVVSRTDEHEGLLDAAQHASDTITPPFHLVVTGDASGVHALRRHVRTWGHQPDRIRGKAYWAGGRTGLD